MPWPTASEWHSFISLPGSLINHVSSCDQQRVSNGTALFLCQAVSSIMCPPMANRMWVTLLYFFARQPHQVNHVSSHGQQYVSDSALFLCQAVSSIMSHPMTNRKWVTLLYFFARQSHQSCPHPMTNRKWVTLLHFFAKQSHQSCLILWPTGSEWHCFISLPGSVIKWIMYPFMTNRMWVTLLYFFAR